mgnify:CR=1 FL=1
MMAWDLGYDITQKDYNQRCPVSNQAYPIRIFKSHQRLSSMNPGAKYIVTIRDPRSTLVSWWKFLKNNDQIVGAMGFEVEMLSYVTTNWDDEIDYLNSIEMFNTLYKVLKSTFGAQYDGDIILELEEINEPSLQKFGISIHSQDGRSVRIKRENISLEIKQIAQKL